MADDVPLFRMEGVSKRYGGVRALDNAGLEVRAGRVHAILGENGAGKSTLIKIMSGVVAPDSGTMRLDGRDVSFPDPAAANAAGIACIFQELSLVPDLSVRVVSAVTASGLLAEAEVAAIVAASPRRTRAALRRAGLALPRAAGLERSVELRG